MAHDIYLQASESTPDTLLAQDRVPLVVEGLAVSCRIVALIHLLHIADAHALEFCLL